MFMFNNICNILGLFGGLKGYMGFFCVFFIFSFCFLGGGYFNCIIVKFEFGEMCFGKLC